MEQLSIQMETKWTCQVLLEKLNVYKLNIRGFIEKFGEKPTG